MIKGDRLSGKESKHKRNKCSEDFAEIVRAEVQKAEKKPY